MSMWMKHICSIINKELVLICSETRHTISTTIARPRTQGEWDLDVDILYSCEYISSKLQYSIQLSAYIQTMQFKITH